MQPVSYLWFKHKNNIQQYFPLQTIASYFQKSTASKAKQETKPETKKRRARVISSSEDEDDKKEEIVKTSKKTKIEDSPSSSPTKNDAKKPKLDKLKKSSPKKEIKPVDVMSMFGGETKRVEAKKPAKPKALQELDDEEIDKSLMDVDMEASILEAEKEHKKGSPKKMNGNTPKAEKKKSIYEDDEEEDEDYEKKDKKKPKAKKEDLNSSKSFGKQVN